MATVAQWIEGGRPRTLPNAIAPVLVGTGAAIGGGAIHPYLAVLALVVALGMIIGVNYANDYSDGVRGADDDRVGPMRLVGSRTATPAAVRTAAFILFGVAVLAGIALAFLSGHWWLLLVGVVCLLGAWFYTGGSHPYGYRGLGELAVFCFFGPVAVLGTSYTQSGPPSVAVVLSAVGVGLLSCSVLVTNNLRDIPSDALVGKRTFAVILGDQGTRRLYAALLIVPMLLAVIVAFWHPGVLIALLAAPVAFPALRRVLRGATGRELIPVLGRSGLAMLVWAVGVTVGLALTPLR